MEGRDVVDAADLNRLIEIGRRQHQLLNEAYAQTVAVLASALESRDFGTSQHSRRVTSYATRLTLEVAPGLLDDPSLEWGFMLHDVGKIGIPDGILLKPGRLTRARAPEMQEHAELGERLLAHVPLLNQEGARVIRSHHERWDGNGYPDRLSEESIPLAARIFAVVDSLDAMTDKRPYRAPVSWDAAAEEIAVAAARTSTRTSSTASRPASPTCTACTWRSSPPEGRGEGGLQRPPSLTVSSLLVRGQNDACTRRRSHPPPRRGVARCR